MEAFSQVRLCCLSALIAVATPMRPPGTIWGRARFVFERWTRCPGAMRRPSRPVKPCECGATRLRAAPEYAAPTPVENDRSRRGVSAMSAQEHVLWPGSPGPRGRSIPPLVGVELQHQRAVRAPDGGDIRPRLKAPGSDRPPSSVIAPGSDSRPAPASVSPMSVFTPSGKPAVEISL